MKQEGLFIKFKHVVPRTNLNVQLLYISILISEILFDIADRYQTLMQTRRREHLLNFNFNVLSLTYIILYRLW